MGGFRGLFLSNELLDAFPVRLIEKEDGAISEIDVSIEGDRFAELRRPCGSEVLEYVSTFCPDLPDGFRTEVNLAVRPWIREVAVRLLEGLALTIDYGYTAREYYDEERSRGTLLCYYGHEMNEDPYRNVGFQDLTAHVNFSALKAWGEEAGLRTIGFSSQGAYLISLGLDEVLSAMVGDEPDPFDMARIKRLILPQGLGESHKVLAQWQGPDRPSLRGFALRNRSASL
jgi:SAM-dependent MidA family methyltransferase